MSMKIDKYGWPKVQHVMPDEAWHFYEQFYETETASGGITYKRLENTNPCVIWKETVTTNGGNTNTKLEFGWGDWSDKANLTYVPINSSLEIDV